MEEATVKLTRAGWNQVMSIIGNTRDFPWTVTNPLLMELGKQLETQLPTIKQTTNSQEMPINAGEIRIKQ